LLAVLPFHVLVQLPALPIAQVAIQYVANATVAVLGAWAILELCPYPRRFDRLRTVLVLVVFAGVIAPLVTSLFMVSAFALAGIPAEFWLTVVVRTITNSFAIVALVPLIVHGVTALRTSRETGSGVAHRRSNDARDRAGVDLHAGLRLRAS
jgi:integral membrane sensor domain MASE1